MGEPFLAGALALALAGAPAFFVAAFALRSVVRLSMLGPRGSFTDMSGSTGSSQSQHRQPSISPISSSRMTAPYRRGSQPFADPATESR